jgi:hypothetical protein
MSSLFEFEAVSRTLSEGFVPSKYRNFIAMLRYRCSLLEEN